jgi:hypothetical protein
VRKKVILNQVKRASHFVKIIVACPHRLPKLPKSTQRKQAIPNKGSLFYSHCALVVDHGKNGSYDYICLYTSNPSDGYTVLYSLWQDHGEGEGRPQNL